ncbi:MAG: sensor histidine kinase [Cyclobacteriaceae bacterium]|nr:sensor histidine kinase [Cyclobacteriaceae bacterium]
MHIRKYKLIFLMCFFFIAGRAEYQYRPYSEQVVAYQLELQPGQMKQYLDAARMYQQLIFSYPDSALALADSMLLLDFDEATRLVFVYWRAKALSAQSRYVEALALVDSMDIRSARSQLFLGDLMVLQARLHKYVDDMEGALPSFLEAESIYREWNDRLGLVVVYINIAEYYRVLSKYELALQYLSEAAEWIDFYKLPLSVKLYALNRKSAVYNELQELDSAKLITEKIILIATQEGNKFLEASSKNELGVILHKEGELQAASDLYFSAIRQWKETGHVRYWASTVGNLSGILIKSGKYQEAKQWLISSLPIVVENNWHSILYSYYELLASISMHEGDYSAVFNYMEMARIEQRMDFQNLMNKELAIQQVEYESNRRQMMLDKAEEDAEKERKGRYFAVFVIVMILFVVSGLMAFVIEIRKRNREIGRINEKLSDTIGQKDALLKDVHHRVKNNLSFLIGLIHLQESETNEVTVKKEFSRIKQRLEAMAMVHSRLIDISDESQVNAVDMIKELQTYSEESFGKKKLIRFVSHNLISMIDSGSAIVLGVILNELITNSLKHAEADNTKLTIYIEYTDVKGKIRIGYYDSGDGLPNPEIFEAPSSVGFKLIRMLVRQLKGTITYIKDVNRFEIELGK